MSKFWLKGNPCRLYDMRVETLLLTYIMKFTRRNWRNSTSYFCSKNYFVSFSYFYILELSATLSIGCCLKQQPTINGWNKVTLFRYMLGFGFMIIHSVLKHTMNSLHWIPENDKWSRGWFKRSRIESLEDICLRDVLKQNEEGGLGCWKFVCSSDLVHKLFLRRRWQVPLFDPRLTSHLFYGISFRPSTLYSLE